MDPTTSTAILFPELLSQEELVKKLKAKFYLIDANPCKIDRMTDVELVAFARKFIMPKPQKRTKNVRKRVCCEANGIAADTNHHLCKRNNDKDYLNGTKMEVGGIRVVKKKNESIMNASSPPTKKRRHSPIRFP